MESSRRNFLKWLAAAAGGAALLGCDEWDRLIGKEKERDIELFVDPPQPLVTNHLALSDPNYKKEPVIFSGHHWTSLNPDLNALDAASPPSLAPGNVHQYQFAGRYVLRVTGDNGQTLDADLVVRHNPKLARIDNTSGLTIISKSEFERFMIGGAVNVPERGKFYLEQSTRDELASFLTSLQSWETLLGYAVAADGLCHKIGITNTAQLPGFTDSDNDSLPEFFGLYKPSSSNPAGTKSALEDLLDNGFHPQSFADFGLAVSQMVPANSLVSDPRFDQKINLSSFGSVLCQYIYDCTFNGVSVTVGINYKSLPDSNDQQAVTAFNNFRSNTYYPVGLLVIPEGTKFDIRKAIGQELDYHKANNP